MRLGQRNGVPAGAHSPHDSHRLRRKLIAALIAACYGAAQANPSAPQVVAGQASFNQQGNLFSITNTPNTIINWQSFSIGANDITRFIQQSSDSKVLNRITCQVPIQILGALQSNGNVFLINPDGVMFGAGSRVDVNGLVASSLNLSDADFLAGKNNFVGSAGAGKVSNQGTITTPGGGQVFLIAPNVDNSGIITSPNGEIILAAGESVQLVDSANPDVHVQISAPLDQALNLGQIVAQGGRIGIYGALVNQRGRISADSAVRGDAGQIILKSSGTTLLEAGSSTSATGAAGGKGGAIELLGPQVGMTGNAVADASGDAGGGSVLLGGDTQGRNPAVMNAQQSYVGVDSVIKADAGGSGNGGKVVVWSDNATRMYGSIAARGGANGGDGGAVETSGHYLDLQGAVNTRAPHGKAGTLLLDPSNITIADSASSAPESANTMPAASGGIFQEVAAGSDSFLSTALLDQALVGGNVTVSTSNAAGSGSGSINLVDALAWTGGHALTLAAASDITLNGAINGGGLILTAATGNITQTAPLQVATLSATAGTGSIALTNSANAVGTATLTAPGGVAFFDATALTLAGGSSTATPFSVAGGGDVNVTGAVSSNGGVISLSAGAGATLTVGAAVSSGNAPITLTADQMAINAPVAAGHALLLVQTASGSTDIALGAGAENASGTLGLSDTQLNYLSTSSLLAIGTSNGDSSSAINVVGSVNFASALAGGGGLLLNTTQGALNVASGATLTVPGIVSLITNASGNARFSNAGAVVAGEGIDIFAGKMTLAGGTLTAPSVSLSSVNSIDLGATSDISGKLVLSAADLASVGNGNGVSSLNVSVNSNNASGNINISQPISLAGNLNLFVPPAATLTAPANLSVGGMFLLSGGNWVQNSATLPALLAHDFQIGPGATFLRVNGGDGSAGSPYQIADVYGLQGAATLPLSSAYVLNGDIDASGTGSWNFGAGLVPIGGLGTPYSGVFNGNGKRINGLTINRGDSADVGLFGSIGAATIENLTLAGGSVVGGGDVGAVVGQGGNNGLLQNVSSSAAVSGKSNVGGLGGDLTGSVIASSASGSVTGLVAGDVANLGGLVGSSGGSIAGSSASGAVLNQGSGSNIGGLVGSNQGSIATSYASGAVSSGGYGYAGGLVGRNASSVTTSYASGAVNASGEIVGGLVGDNNGGSIALSYASGNVAGGRNVGGLAGRNISGTISDAYATGNVSANLNGTVEHANMAGLVGDNYSGSVLRVIAAQESGTLTAGYYSLSGSGLASDGAGGVGLTAGQMLDQASFVGFDFSSAPVWRIYAGHTTPLLKPLLDPLQVTVTGNGQTKIYDGQSASLDGSGVYSGFVGGDSLDNAATSGVLNGALGYDGASNVGSYNVGGLWSTKYDISYLGATAPLLITPRSITATVGGSKVYDTQLSFLTPDYSFNNAIAGDALWVNATLTFADKNVGTGKPLSISGAVLTGASAGNYLLTGVSGSADISKAPVALGGVAAASRTYDGLPDVVLTVTPSVTALVGDALSVSGDGTVGGVFADKSAGVGKPVTVTIAGYVLGGAAAGNYTLVAPTNVTATIRPKALTISGLSALDRVYDADVDAHLSGGTLNGVINGDQVSLSASASTATFADPHVGSGKAVTVFAVALGGDD